VDWWENLARQVYAPGQLAQMADMLAAMRNTLTQFGDQLNLADVFTGSWLGAPSAMATATSTRLTFISDMVLAQAGLTLNLPHMAPAPWRSATVEIGSWWAVIVLVVVGWLVSQLLAAFYLRWIAHDWRNPGQADDFWAGSSGFLSLAVRVTMLCLILGMLVFLLRLPLGVVMALMVLSGSSVMTTLTIFVGGMMLWLLMWFLASFFFAGEAVILDRQPLLKGIWQSLVLVRLNGWTTLGLVVVINVVLFGFRAVWGLIGRTPAGAAVAIVGNAYLATGMLLGVFTYYDELRRRWQVQLAKITKLSVATGAGDQRQTPNGKS
jgi:hypothetical protein